MQQGISVLFGYLVKCFPNVIPVTDELNATVMPNVKHPAVRMFFEIKEAMMSEEVSNHTTGLSTGGNDSPAACFTI